MKKKAKEKAYVSANTWALEIQYVLLTRHIVSHAGVCDNRKSAFGRKKVMR